MSALARENSNGKMVFVKTHRQTNNIYHSKLHKISLFSGPILGLFRQIGIYVKEKHSTLHKTVSSVKVGSIAEYFTLNSTQFSRTTVDIFSCINFKLLRQIAKNILFNCATRLSFFIINNFGFNLPYF